MCGFSLNPPPPPPWAKPPLHKWLLHLTETPCHNLTCQPLTHSLSRRMGHRVMSRKNLPGIGVVTFTGSAALRQAADGDCTGERWRSLPTSQTCRTGLKTENSTEVSNRVSFQLILFYPNLHSTGSTPTGSTPTGSTPTGSTPTGSTPSVCLLFCLALSLSLSLSLSLQTFFDSSSSSWS